MDNSIIINISVISLHRNCITSKQHFLQTYTIKLPFLHFRNNFAKPCMNSDDYVPEPLIMPHTALQYHTGDSIGPNEMVIEYKSLQIPSSCLQHGHIK